MKKYRTAKCGHRASSEAKTCGLPPAAHTIRMANPHGFVFTEGGR